MEMSKKSGAIAIVLIVVVAQACAFLARPLGPALTLATETAVASSVVTPDTSGPTSTSAAQPFCGGPPVMNVLGIGTDARANNYVYGLSDVMRIIRVDFVTPRVTILEFPRDLWVEIPEISSHYGITHGKLNQAYLYGNPGFGYYSGKGLGPELLAKTLDLNFGMRPDHYVAVNMQTFSAIVDEVGGLDLYLPYDVDVRTPEFPDAPFYPAGHHHMDGQTALMLARIRQYNVFGRADNQNIVMCALRKKILSPSVVVHIPEFIDTFKRYVQTDFSPEQISQLACLVPKVESKNITFISFPQSLFKNTRIYDPQLKKEVFIFDADFNILRDYVVKFNQGSWPPLTSDLATAPVIAGATEEYTCP